MAATDYDEPLIESRDQWRAWLAAHHDSAPGAWVVTWKKSSGGPYVGYDELVEEALCFGWVDSRSRAVDERRSGLLMTPRRPRSGWSRPNKERVARLLADGRMTPAGVAVVERARADGSWTALDGVENLIEPQELAAALDADPEARRHWDAFPRSARRAILEWIAGARRPDTRARRIAETARSAAQGIRANEWRRPEERNRPGR